MNSEICSEVTLLASGLGTGPNDIAADMNDSIDCLCLGGILSITSGGSGKAVGLFSGSGGLSGGFGSKCGLGSVTA